MSTITAPDESVVTPDLILDYAYDRTARSIAHDPLDRSDPDVTLRPVSLRAGTLALFCLTRATASAIEDAHRLLGVFVLDASDDEATASMSYVPVGRIGVSWDATFDRWRVDVTYREVA